MCRRCRAHDAGRSFPLILSEDSCGFSFANLDSYLQAEPSGAALPQSVYATYGPHEGTGSLLLSLNSLGGHMPSTIQMPEFATCYRAHRRTGLPAHGILVGAALGRIRTLEVDGRLLVHIADCERLAQERNRARLTPQTAA